MHYTLSYENVPLNERHDKALADTAQYLGRSRFNAVLLALTETARTYYKAKGCKLTNLRKLRLECVFGLEMVGVQWFAAKAMIREAIRAYHITELLKCSDKAALRALKAAREAKT